MYNVNESLSEFLSTELEARRWSMRELGRRADVSGSLVSEVISGNVPASANFCVAVARALDVSPEHLLRLSGILPGQAPPVREEEEAIKLLRALSPQARQSALAMLKGLREGERGGPGGRPAGRDWFPETMAALPEGITQAQLRDVVMAEIRRIVDEDSADDVAVLASLFQQYASLRKAIQKQEEAEPAN